ncbi:DNA mismatch repair protein muts, putative, partial [Entamoeba invadens IP1]
MEKFDREVVMALCETKGKEIGVCWFECGTNNISLSQYLDTNTYVQTLILVNIKSPSQIIVSKTQEKSELTQLLLKENKKVTFFPRSAFNENDGVTLSETLFMSGSSNIIRKNLESHYLCAAAFNALVQKMEKTAFVIQPGVINGKFVPLTNKVTIDVQTAQQLELITNNIDEKTNGSLFEVMNSTITNVGRKELIDNLLQPPSDVETIRDRQNTIEYFLRNSEDYYKCLEHLKQLPDLDKIITAIIQLTKTDGLKQSTLQSILKNFFNLYKLLAYIPQFKDSIAGLKNAPLIFGAMKIVLEDVAFGEMKESLDALINESAAFSKQSRNNICFLVKQNISPYLDVSRQILAETLQEVDDIAQKAAQSGLSIKTTKNGFLFVFNGEQEKIPENCCRVVKLSNTKYSVNTPELLSLSNKFRSTKEEIVQLSINVLARNAEAFKKNIPSLNKLSEVVGLLDMLICFVTYASSHDLMCRPIFNNNRSIIIKQGKHPVLATTLPKFVPNDTFIDDTSRFCLINGPNMGGKSTYIRQVALLEIMAHMGSFVPAEAVTLRPLSKIMSRLSIDDSVETNQSSFMKEMKEINEILHETNDSSLILVDELGRGTSVLDGVSVAWAVSEEILNKSLATCLFVSHFPEMNKLEKLYPQVVREYHMEFSL